MEPTNSIYGSSELGHEQLHLAEVTSQYLCGSYHNHAFNWLPEYSRPLSLTTDTMTDRGRPADAA